MISQQVRKIKSNIEYRGKVEQKSVFPNIYVEDYSMVQNVLKISNQLVKVKTATHSCSWWLIELLDLGVLVLPNISYKLYSWLNKLLFH